MDNQQGIMQEHRMQRVQVQQGILSQGQDWQKVEDRKRHRNSPDANTSFKRQT